MKILSIGNFTHGWDGSLCDEEHIASALEELGHEVHRLQREGITDTGLLTDVDFVLISQWNGYSPNMIGVIKQMNTPVVYWAFDYQEDGQEWHEKLVSLSDLYLSKRVADSKYPNWQWLSQDFAPSFLDKYPDRVQKDIDVLFTGSYLPWATERNATLKAVDEKFDLTIHSFTPDAWKAQGFKNVYGPKMDDELPYLIARAKVNLSIDHTIEAGYWSDRNAQIMCCGGFVLTRYVPLMSTVFHSLVGYYYDIDTCLQSLEYWLEVDEDRENLAGFGYDYAQEYLTVKERMNDLLNIVHEVL